MTDPDSPPPAPAVPVVSGGVTVVVLCTANICRSPMGEALLADRLVAAGVVATVSSAGQLESGVAPPPEAVAAMVPYGLDTAGHRSRRLTAADIEGADLVVAMARMHVRHAVVLVPEAWPRIFTLKEVVRLGTASGPRHPGESLEAWLGRIGDGRQRAALLGESEVDDVADPIGGSPEAYAATAAVIADLVGRLVELAWPASSAAGDAAAASAAATRVATHITREETASP